MIRQDDEGPLGLRSSNPLSPAARDFASEAGGTRAAGGGMTLKAAKVHPVGNME
jgi:hypothetical protein